MKDLVVREAEKTDAKLFYQGLSLGVEDSLGCLVVDLAVDFDRQAAFAAVEVHDETVDGVLPAELQAAEPPVAKLFPKKSLGLRHRLT